MIHGLIDCLENGTVRKTCICEDPYSMEFMTACINHFIKHPDPLVVLVSNFKKLKKQTYTYDMVRLNSLSLEEEKLIDWVGDLDFDYGATMVIPYIDSKMPMTRTHFPILMDFLDQVYSKNHYHDIHGGNVMIDNYGNYKLVDLEGFVNAPLSNRVNNWITR